MLVSADVMIHEIMYHPASEDDREEYIELYNPDDEAHDLSGWRFIKGVDFEFAEGVRIESGGYLVIASDPSVFGQPTQRRIHRCPMDGLDDSVTGVRSWF